MITSFHSFSLKAKSFSQQLIWTDFESNQNVTKDLSLDLYLWLALLLDILGDSKSLCLTEWLKCAIAWLFLSSVCGKAVGVERIDLLDEIGEPHFYPSNVKYSFDHIQPERRLSPDSEPFTRHKRVVQCYHFCRNCQHQKTGLKTSKRKPNPIHGPYFQSSLHVDVARVIVFSHRSVWQVIGFQCGNRAVCATLLLSQKNRLTNFRSKSLFVTKEFLQIFHPGKNRWTFKEVYFSEHIINVDNDFFWEMFPN